MKPLIAHRRLLRRALLILALAVSALVAGFGPGAIPALALITSTTPGAPIVAVETFTTGTITVASFVTDTPGDVFTATINWGDTNSSAGTIVADGGGNFHVTGSHTYAEDGSYTFTTTITEAGASPDSKTTLGATATVTEQQLSITADASSWTEGQSGTMQVAHFSDPGSPDLGSAFTTTIDWGDGSAPTSGTVTATGGGNYTVNGTHTYADEGSYTVQVTMSETSQAAFGSLTAGATATVGETDSLTPVGKTLTVPVAQSFTTSVATFFDTYPSAPASDFTATIDWGDSTSSTGTVSGPPGGPFTVTGTHTYASPAQYTVLTTLQDDAPGTAKATAVSTINAAAPPVLIKSFGAPTIPLGGSTTLNFLLTNPNNFVGLSAVGFTDILPAGLVIASPNGLTSTCSGGIAAVAGSNSLALTGTTLPASGSCSIQLNVTGVSPGNQVNVTSAITSNVGTGNVAVAGITVIAPPTASKSFTPPVIPLMGTSTLAITITNPNASTALTGLAFTDSLPAGLVVATPAALSNTCGGTATATAGAGTLTLSGGNLAGGASCTVSVNVTGIAFGIQNNSVVVSSTNGGNSNTATSTLTVAQPPSLAKSFGAATIPLGGSTSLTFTITNPNATVTLHGIGFTDTLPSGLVIATPNGQTGSCGGGAITATAGTSTLSLAGATLAPGAACTFSINVKGITAGVQTNTTGAVTSTEGGTGNTATASITVVAPPVILKAFGAPAIAPHGTTTLTFSISNPNTTVSLTGVAFTDTLPSGLVVATPNGLTGSCGGGTITATAGSGTISLAGATLPPSGNCTFAVNVTSTGATGLLSNSVQVTSSNGGTGNTSTSTITVAFPAKLVKGFALPSVPVHSPVKLTFKVTNPNTFSLTGVAFTDIMPLGLLVNTPNGLTGTCGGGAISAVAGQNTISLTGATLTAGTTCTFSVYVIGTSFGWKHNVTSPVTADNAPAGNAAVATILI